MGRQLFLVAEALLFTAVLSLSWGIVRRGFARLSISLPALGLISSTALGVVLLGVNFGLTQIWGPSFTALYRLSGVAFVGAIAIYLLCLMARRTAPSASEPS